MASISFCEGEGEVIAEWGQGFMENDGDLEGLLGVGGTREGGKGLGTHGQIDRCDHLTLHEELV